MTTLYLIRHAEAEGNLFRRNHGQYDSLLTPFGLRQREALAKRFADLPIDTCFSSDLTRACMTAQAICRPHGLPLTRCPEFREVNFGVWEDLPFGYIDHTDGERMARYRQDPCSLRLEGAERYEVYTGRFIQKMTELAQEFDGKTIAIFSHGAVLRDAQTCLFQSQPDAPLPLCDNTGVSLLRYENGSFTAEYLNDNSHLGDELSTLRRLGPIMKEARRWNLWFQPAGNDPAGLPALFDEAVKAQRIAPFSIALDDCIHAYLQDSYAGSLLLSKETGEIRFLALRPELRRHRLGPQLLGEAVSRFRTAGFEQVLVTLPAANQEALAFFESCGFQRSPSPTPDTVSLALDICLSHADVPE